MDNLTSIFISALLVNNFVLSYFLGLCPFFGVSGKLETAFRLGLATTFVMVITALAAWVLNTFVLVHAPYLRLISFIVVIASTVQFVEMVISPASYPWRLWDLPDYSRDDTETSGTGILRSFECNC